LNSDAVTCPFGPFRAHHARKGVNLRNTCNELLLPMTLAQAAALMLAPRVAFRVSHAGATRCARAAIRHLLLRLASKRHVRTRLVSDQHDGITDDEAVSLDGGELRFLFSSLTSRHVRRAPTGGIHAMPLMSVAGLLFFFPRKALRARRTISKSHTATAWTHQRSERGANVGVPPQLGRSAGTAQPGNPNIERTSTVASRIDDAPRLRPGEAARPRETAAADRSRRPPGFSNPI
jgi:hypothetical protein